MDKLAIAVGGTFLFIGGVFLTIILTTFFGGVAGWIVGLVFSDTILGILSQLGVKGVTMFQFGAFMGFVGGFLKTKVTAEVKASK